MTSYKITIIIGIISFYFNSFTLLAQQGVSNPARLIHANFGDTKPGELHSISVLKDSIEKMHENQHSIQRLYKIKLEKELKQQSLLNEKKIISAMKMESNRRYKIIAGATVIIFSILSFLLFSILLHQKDRRKLMQEIEELKGMGRLFTQVGFSDGNSRISINKKRTEQFIQSRLNDTDWSILEMLHKNPFISNNELAASVNRSLEGVSSSLRKMYGIFDINEKANKKQELLKKVLHFSNSELSY